MKRLIVFALVGIVGSRADAQVSSALSNPGFERGLQGWTKTGTAFDSQPTYGESVQGSRVAPILVGGDYWTDIPYAIGIRGNSAACPSTKT